MRREALYILTIAIGLLVSSQYQEWPVNVWCIGVFSFIYWKMEYHIEHHMFPMVPSHQLPKLHELIKEHLPEPQSLLEAYKEIIPAVIKQAKDPNYHITVSVPEIKKAAS